MPDKKDIIENDGKTVPTPEQIAQREAEKKQRREEKKKLKKQLKQEEIKKFKRKDRLMTFLWIFLFPFMMTGWIWKTDTIKYRILKIFMILLMWVLIIRLALHVPTPKTNPANILLK